MTTAIPTPFSPETGLVNRRRIDRAKAGALAVHKEWLAAHERGDGPPRGDPDFSEAARDYAALAPGNPGAVEAAPQGAGPVTYSYDEKHNIVLPDGAPFDGEPALVRFAAGWCEARWEAYDRTADDGFCWVCLDDSAPQQELDDAREWMPLPGKTPSPSPATQPQPDSKDVREALKPYSYGYQFHDCVRFSDREVNGARPISSFPLYDQKTVDGLLAKIAALTARVDAPAAPPADWQLIETAPRDFTPILALENFTRTDDNDLPYPPDRMVVQWSEKARAWISYGLIVSSFEPTHWMPLPLPPDAGSRG